MNKLQNFVVWLDAYIEDFKNLDNNQTNKIKRKVNDLFEYEANSNQDKPTLKELGDKHGFKIIDSGFRSENSDGVKYRC